MLAVESEKSSSFTRAAEDSRLDFARLTQSLASTGSAVRRTSH